MVLDSFTLACNGKPVFDNHCVSCHDFGQKAGESLILAAEAKVYEAIRTGQKIYDSGIGK
jgi:mono/diheme cytochrome c family protein